MKFNGLLAASLLYTSLSLLAEDHPRPAWAPQDFTPRNETDPGVERGPAKVQWKNWSAETFAEANHAGKPILLFVTAPWCHAGRIMERTAFTDAGVVALLNEYFVPIRLDRDERPDVDLRLQQAVQAISQVRGWPLTVCLTPDGRVFFGGTSYTADDDFTAQKPGLRATLRWLASLWKDGRDQVFERAGAVEKLFKETNAAEKTQGQAPDTVLHQLAVGMRATFDERTGGSRLEASRFPEPRALEACLLDFGRTHDKDTLKLVTTSVDAMLRGALYDRLGGGFHRCCVDRRWRVPRFEKFLIGNAELLTLLLHTWQASGDERYKDALIKTMNFWNAPPMYTARSLDGIPFGWAASQAADINSADDGDYFTWTIKEIEAALRDDTDCRLACALFQIDENGDLPQTAPSRNILFEAMTLPDAAKKIGIDEADARQRLPRIESQLLRARNSRPMPTVDPTIFTDGNALMAAAAIECGRVLRHKDWVLRGEEVLNELLTSGVKHGKGGDRFVHFIQKANETSAPVAGLLQDDAAIFYACAIAFEATGKEGYALQTQSSFERLNQNFWEPVSGGYLDRMPGMNGEPEVSLPWTSKPFMDTSEPPANGLIAQGCVRMFALTGKKEYRDRAAATVEAFGGTIVKLSAFGATLTAAADALQHGVTLISIEGNGKNSDADALFSAAHAAYAPWKFVINGGSAPAAKARVAHGLAVWDALNTGATDGFKSVTSPAELTKLLVGP